MGDDGNSGNGGAGFDTAPDSGLRSSDHIPVSDSQPFQSEDFLNIYEPIIASAHIPMAFFSPDGVYRMVNPEYMRRFSQPMEEVVGRSASEVLGGESFELGFKPYFDRCLMGQAVGLEDWQEMAEGHRRYMTKRFQPLYAVDGRIKGVVEIGYDMTNQKLAEEALRVSEHELWIKNQIAQAFLTSQDNRVYSRILEIVLDVMGCKSGHFGYLDDHGDLMIPAVAGEAWQDWQAHEAGFVYPAAHWSGPMGDSLRKGHTVAFNEPDDFPPISNLLAVAIVHPRAVIGQLVVTNRDRPFGYYCRQRLESIATQVAPVLHARREDERHLVERRRLKEQLIATQKMEAIGTLAGGIAHDFNNILSAIMGFADLAMEDVEDRPLVHEGLTEILHACYRARELVHQILTFSRKTKQERKPLLMQSLIKEIMKLLRGSLPASIDIRTILEVECPPVLADPSQIHQVVMNLCTNAFQAMRKSAAEPAHSDRKNILTVKLHSCTVDKALARKLVDIKPGQYVEFIVRDTGKGISEEILDRIFDPYFSTRRGDGSGLGLAVVQGIVNNHGGTIYVKSEIDKGTAFHVLFPIYREGPVEVASTAESGAPTSGPERLLFVDDEPAIRDLAQRGLERMGYTVDICSSGEEALALINVQNISYQAVITDLTMPRMSGAELAELIKQIHPDLPVLLCSGYSEDKNLESNPLFSAVLKKPLTMKEIARHVRRILDTTEWG